MCVCESVYFYVCVFMCMYVYECVCINVCVRVCVCMCVGVSMDNTYRSSGSLNHKHTDKYPNTFIYFVIGGVVSRSVFFPFKSWNI